MLHFVHGLALERVILGADGLGPFECHVLEHVRDAGLAARIVHRTGVDIGMERDHRRLMTLENMKCSPLPSVNSVTRFSKSLRDCAASNNGHK